MESLPPGEAPLTRHRRNSVTVYVNADAADAVDVDAVFQLPGSLQGLEGGSSRQAGRPTWWRWDPDWSPRPLLVRQYVHGGALGPVFGSVFPGPSRMVAELQVSAYAHRSGVPTPRPLAVRTERALGPLVGGYFVGELVPGAMDLLALCKEVCGGRPAPRRAIVASVGAAIARMHETGIEHADLNLRNILVRRPFDEPHALVIDFDRARLRGRLSPARRMRNLKRLDRSLRKWGVSRAAVRVLDRVRLLRAYAAECAGTPVDWRAWMRAGRD